MSRSPEQDEIRVGSWDELLAVLYREAWRPELERYRSPYVFRGDPDAAQGLVTGLAQLGGNYTEMEQHLLRNFRKYAAPQPEIPDTLWNWLSLGQHHGLPTRLLDWTVSPLVAAHFATDSFETFDRDGVIWMVDCVQAQRYAPEQLKHRLDAEQAEYFTVEMLAETVATLEALDGLAPPDFVLFFEPPAFDARITNQYALFSVMAGASSRLDDWLEAHNGIWRKVILPAEVKGEVRDKLDQANVTERVLFPGLDGLSRWLQRYYTPRKTQRR